MRTGTTLNRYLRKCLVLSLGILIVLISSCSKDPIRPVNPPPQPIPDDSTSYSNGFFIVNEGNFNWGNASVTFVDSKTGSVYQDLFQQVNHRPLGDVAQSMKVLNNRGYIVVNNSNRLEVVDLTDFKTITSIEGFHAPRYIEFIDSSKAYVTNLYKDITVVDLGSLSITRTIHTPDWTESMIRFNEYMFVTCIGNFAQTSSKRKAKVFIIDVATDNIIDSIQTPTEPTGIVVDKKLKIWVLCSGGWDQYEAPVLLRINPDIRQIEKTFTFSGNSIPSRLTINPTGDTLYFLNGGIFQMAVNHNELPSTPLVAPDNHLFYGLAIHPENGSVFATDAIDYVQNGLAFQFSSSDGSLLQTWPTGRIPGFFCFAEAPYR